MRPFWSIAIAAMGIAAVGPAGAMDTAATPPLPGQREELIAYVVRALNTHDLDAIDSLVEWEGRFAVV